MSPGRGCLNPPVTPRTACQMISAVSGHTQFQALTITAAQSIHCLMGVLGGHNTIVCDFNLLEAGVNTTVCIDIHRTVVHRQIAGPATIIINAPGSRIRVFRRNFDFCLCAIFKGDIAVPLGGNTIACGILGFRGNINIDLCIVERDIPSRFELISLFIFSGTFIVNAEAAASNIQGAVLHGQACIRALMSVNTGCSTTDIQRTAILDCDIIPAGNTNTGMRRFIVLPTVYR